MHIAVIGSYGSAGVASANHILENSQNEVDKVTLIDGGEPGGLCILRGCMPSKAVLSSAEHVHSANVDPRIRGEVQVDTPKTVEHKDNYIESFAEHRGDSVKEISRNDSFELIESKAGFLNEDTIELSNGDTIEPDYTILATGSSLNIPDINGINSVDYLKSSDILNAKELPDSVIIIGFGTIGLEMSAYLSSAGVDVTAIEHDKKPLDSASDAFGHEVLDIYEEKFDIEIITEAYEESIEKTDDDRVKVNLSGDSSDEVEADELCLFTGRNPNINGLSLDNLGISTQEYSVSSSLRVEGTESVFAAGDVTGDRMILHIAKEQGVLAVDNILRDHKSKNLKEFSSPEHIVYFCGNSKYPYARYGITGDKSEEREELITVTRDASDDGIFKLKEASMGKAKLAVNKYTGEVKGYEGLHLHSDVMVKSIQIIIENNLTVQDVPSRAYHPTTPELLDGLIREAREELQ
jgi:dihydrolipoamide dehydrogenase